MNSLWRRLAAVPAVMALLSGCAGAGFEAAAPSSAAACPPWPVAGPAVAAELERLSEADYPATWAWIDRVAVLREQLALCRGEP